MHPVYNSVSEKMVVYAHQARDKHIISEGQLERLKDGFVSFQDKRAARKVFLRHCPPLGFEFFGRLAFGLSDRHFPNSGLASELNRLVQARGREQGFLRTLGESFKDLLP